MMKSYVVLVALEQVNILCVTRGPQCEEMVYEILNLYGFSQALEIG